MSVKAQPVSAKKRKEAQGMEDRARQGKRTPDVVWQWIDQYVQSHPEAREPDVRRGLEGSDLAHLTPQSPNTIRSILKTLKDQSPPWQMSKPSADDADPALVLPVLGALLEEAGGPRSVSKDEARWITGVRRAIPDIPLLWAYYMARHYIVAAGQGRPTDGHDRFLALKMWEDDDRRADFVSRGLVPPLGPYRWANARLAQGSGTAWNASVTVSESRVRERPRERVSEP